MSWQEELRRLDVELAEGRITHERHRKLRDELLAGASGGATPSPFASPLRRADEHQWKGTIADLSTSAPSPADMRATDSMPFPRSAPAGINAPSVTRPAVRSPAPASVITAQPTRPAADPIPTGTANHAKPTWLFLAAGVLMVLVVIITGSWWLGSGTEENHTRPLTQAPPAALAQAPRPALEDQLPALPGAAEKNNSTVSIAKGVELGLYPAQAADAFTKNGVTEVIYRGSTEGDNAYFVLVVPAKTTQNARALVDFLSKTALNSGFSRILDSQSVVSGQNGDRRMNGTWYASGSTMVNLWVSQPLNADQKTLTERLDRTLASLSKALPET